MDSSRSKLCFMCDTEVVNKGICLRVEKTYFTKTAFPTRISQLIGDTFMVVVADDDRLCVRCATLINRSDKLEMDLIKIKQLITGFLNIKYNLNAAKDYTYFSEGLEDSEMEDECEDFNVIEIVSRDRISQDDSTQSGVKHPLFDENNDMGLVDESDKSNVFIKSEPPHCKYCNQSCVNCNSTSLKKQQSAQFVSEVLLRKLPEDDSVPDNESLAVKKLSCRVDSRVTQMSQDGTILSKIKNEIPSSLDFNFNNETATSKVVKVENTPAFAQSGLGDETSLAHFSSTTRTEHLSLLDEKLTRNAISCNCDKEMSPVGLPTDSGTPNGKVKKAPTRKPKAKPRVVRNALKKDQINVSVKKLRPILPKIQHFSDILAPLCIIESSSPNIVEMCASSVIEMYNSNNTKAIKTENAKKRFFQMKDAKVESVNPTDCTIDSTAKVNISVDEPKVGEKVTTHETSTAVCCKFCNMNFENLETLKNHEKEHSQNRKLQNCSQNRKMHRCSLCERVFKTRSGLKNHEAVHTGNYAFFCDFCGHGFTTRGGLEEHRSSHTKEERYICDVCGKKFSFQSTYWIHRKWHDNPYPYKCNECGKRFKHTSMLAVHKRKHTGERPYKCLYCSLTFAVSSSYKRHMILHTKEYPFNCDICKQGFTTRYKHTEHFAKTHNIIIDKPCTEKKNYKMAVHDDEMESTSPEKSLTTETDVLEGSEGGTRDAQNLIQVVSDELNEGVIEVVIKPSSVLYQHSLTLSDSWLS